LDYQLISRGTISAETASWPSRN